MLCDIGGTVLERRGGGMTENIAIYCLKAASELNTEMCEECPLYGQTGADHCCEDALQVAIKALEELQQYRTIGTVEELQEMKKDFAEALSDWRQYRKVGTLEECRAAVEKQTAKRPRIMGNAMICPSCPRCFKSDNSAYCPSCGQKLKWEDEE